MTPVATRPERTTERLMLPGVPRTVSAWAISRRMVPKRSSSSSDLEAGGGLSRGTGWGTGRRLPRAQRLLPEIMPGRPPRAVLTLGVPLSGVTCAVAVPAFFVSMVEVSELSPWGRVAVVLILDGAERDPDETALSKRLVFWAMEHEIELFAG